MSRDAVARIGFMFSAMATVLVGVGCAPKSGQTTRETPAYGDLPRHTSHAEPTPPESRHNQHEEIEYGRSVGGRPLVVHVYGSGENTILIMASIHGNENVGTPLVRRLGTYLLEQPELLDGRRVVLIPLVNPDGVAVNMRNNLRGVDLNRNFPASNYTVSNRHGASALSEPESRALATLIDKYAPKRIITIHQPLKCIDYDGPAEGLARAMATSSDLPLKRIGSLPGSLGSYAGVSKRIPIVTVEFARSADELPEESLWNRYGKMLLIGICHPQAVPGR